ncbi:ThuA domain-containing protein [Prosthecobacter vanneervenii]|uniref:Type 1 glutamine amidotransferase n=1 Tax=Prosthecobacter vanneervenii TaxID=48466 RepID=A0A7W7YAX5_9BACT|nr:ThuA domain-containing protein [Prosthecobacter vanneervenii]MBB5032851.1 type 1 glutamine amidotransferase [Prosthecobacter vanneervenii]
MKFILLCFALLTCAASAANIVIMTVEDPNNYEAPRTMREFAEKELRPLGHQVTIIEGDKPQPHHFAGLVEALKEADLLVLFSRRRFPPKEQMAAIRAHLAAGKPLLGIRTANHAFIPKPKEVVDPGLEPWPDFTHEVLGGENAGYETKGLPYSVRVLDGVKTPLLEGVNVANIQGYQSLYKVLPLAADATPILIGTAQAGATTPPQPVAWTRSYGSGKARIFYTSLGAPEDMRSADLQRLLRNAVEWTLKK